MQVWWVGQKSFKISLTDTVKKYSRTSALTHSVCEIAIDSDSLCIHEIFTGARRENRTTTLSVLFVTIAQEQDEHSTVFAITVMFHWQGWAGLSAVAAAS